MIRSLLIIITLGVFASSNAQTKIIAWKMHSGNMSRMDWSIPDNLGMPTITLDTIFLINDSTIVEVSKMWSHGRIVDTVVNHPYCRPEMGLDSIKRFYPSNVVFIGFDSTSRLTVPPYSVEYDTLKNRINSRSEVMEDQESFPGFVDGNRPGPFNGFPANSAPGNFWTPEITLILSAIFIVGFMTVRFLTKKRIAA